MTTIWTVLFTLLGILIGFAAAGFGAASVLTSVFGARDGGPGMTGFFYFGPIGALAGGLLAAGLITRHLQRSWKRGLGLLIAGGVVTLLGSMLLSVVVASDRQSSSYSEVIEFELEYPLKVLAGIDIPSSHAMWGAAGGDLNANPVSQFFEKRCSGDVCILQGSVAAQGPMNNFRIQTLIGESKQTYLIDLPSVISGPLGWSSWRGGHEGRIRWRVVKK